LRIPTHPLSTLFPYTTLFRSELRFSPDHAGRDAIDIGNFRTAKPKRIAAAGRLLLLGVGMALGWLHRKREHRRKQQTKLKSFGSDRKSTRLNSSHVAISYAVF